MNDVMDMLFDVIGDILKLFMIAVIVIISLEVLGLNIVAYKTIEQAEKEGCFNYSKFETNLNKLSFDTKDIIVRKVEPIWGEKVRKLGDSMYLQFEKKFIFKIFNKAINFKMTIKANGINQGYYGEGY